MIIFSTGSSDTGSVPRDTPPTWTEYARELGLNLARARAEAGLSQERLAHDSGLAAYTLQKFERGHSKPGTPMNPRLTTLVALCQTLEISLHDLLPTPFPDALAHHAADESNADPNRA